MRLWFFTLSQQDQILSLDNWK